MASCLLLLTKQLVLYFSLFSKLCENRGVTLPILGSGRDISPAMPRFLLQTGECAAAQPAKLSIVVPQHLLNLFHVEGQGNATFSLHRTQGRGDHGRNHAKWGSNSKRARRAALQVSPHGHWLTTWVKGLSEESGFTTTLEKHQHKHKLG